MLNWRQKAAARSALRLAIEDLLDTGLPPAYTLALYAQKCAALFEHLFERHPEWGTHSHQSSMNRRQQQQPILAV